MILKQNGFLIVCILAVLLSIVRCNYIKQNPKSMPDTNYCSGFIYKSTWNKDGQYIIQTASGDVLVTIYGDINDDSNEKMSGGCHVMINKKVSALKNNAYSDYLRSKGIDYVLNASKNDVTLAGNQYNIKSIFSRARVNVRHILHKIMPEEYASVAFAIMTGSTVEMDEKTTKQYQMAGILHVTAVSGMHVNVIMRPVNLIVKRSFLTYKVRGVCRIISAVLFMFLTDFSHSVVRAVLMYTYRQAAMVFDRPATFSNSIYFAAIIQLLANPFVIYSTGFVLSYVAVLSICYISPIIPICNEKLRGIRDAIGVNMGMIPLLLYYFGEISLISIFINGAAGFLSGLICISGYICCLLMSIPVVSFIGNFAGYICTFFTFILNKCAYIASFFPPPIGSLSLNVKNKWIIFLVYIILVAVVFLLQKREKSKKIDFV